MEPPVATFSIVAYDPDTGDLGIAVQSKFFGVGAVVPWAKAGVGAIATQAAGNTRYGPEGLKLLESGMSAKKVVRKLTDADPGREYRQLGIVDAKGNAASFTGKKANDWKGHVVGKHYCCQGNILTGEEVVKAMGNAFENTKGPLPDRLVAALRAGQAAGGDSRGKQSAALYVVRKNGGYAGFNDRWMDIRVDDHKTPIEELARLLEIHKKTFPAAPTPNRKRGKVVVEGEIDSPLKFQKSPRAVFERALDLFVKKEFKSIYEMCTEEFKKKISLEDFIKGEEASYDKAVEYIREIRYVETEYADDNTALVFFTHVARSRPSPFKIVKKGDTWKLPQF
ncbi:MAG: DUF1028 domain-containing protein [Planctomycetota bacterium]|nr:MAG: DUF1028 domain-containing protein [Planctomycetota bacterium]